MKMLSLLPALPALMASMLASAAPADVSISDRETGEALIQTCRSATLPCKLTSLLPPSLRVGSMANCISSSLDNQRIDTGPAGTYLLYRYKNSCGKAAMAFIRISNKWHEGGILGSGERYLQVLYNPGDAVVSPGAIMFCPLGQTPRDDVACTGVAPAADEQPATEGRVEYFIQVGAYRVKTDAEAARATLAAAGMGGSISVRTQSGRNVYRLRIGPFNSVAEANKVDADARRSGFDGVLVRMEK